VRDFAAGGFDVPFRFRGGACVGGRAEFVLRIVDVPGFKDAAISVPVPSVSRLPEPVFL
jgi:hypothetical protein